MPTCVVLFVIYTHTLAGRSWWPFWRHIYWKCSIGRDHCQSFSRKKCYISWPNQTQNVDVKSSDKKTAQIKVQSSRFQKTGWSLTWRSRYHFCSSSIYVYIQLSILSSETDSKRINYFVNKQKSCCSEHLNNTTKGNHTIVYTF